MLLRNQSSGWFGKHPAMFIGDQTFLKKVLGKSVVAFQTWLMPIKVKNEEDFEKPIAKRERERDE